MTDNNDNNNLVERIAEKLELMAVPMDECEFSNKEYNRVFPRGTVSTPIGEVKIGENQFSKMAEKDKGNRQKLIGAMRQTLSDPIIIIKEVKENRIADVFIKSFTTSENKEKSVIISVVVDIKGAKIAISTYKRKKREVVSKIKKADGIVYLKDNSGSRTNGE